MFADCTSIKSVVVETENKKYHSENDCLIETDSKTLLLGCESSVIPADGSVTVIGQYAFSCRGRLKNFIIPNSVTTIEDLAFSSCGMESITIPNSVTTIGTGAFYNCSSLKSIVIPDSVTSIGECAFYYCDSLESITIPGPISTIGVHAFGYFMIKGNHYKNGDFTVYGIKGYAAETYATENGFTFIDLATLPKADSKEYIDTITETMPNVVEKTTAVKFITSLSSLGISAKIADKDGVSLTSGGIVGTGCKVTDSNDNVYTVIVKGDVDGTGEVDATDYLQIKKQFLGENELTGVYFTASDIDGDGEITSTDYLQIKSHFIGQSNLFN